MNARVGSPLAARHAAMGLWEQSGRDLHSHARNLASCRCSYRETFEDADQGHVQVSEGGLNPETGEISLERGGHGIKVTRACSRCPAIRRRVRRDAAVAALLIAVFAPLTALLYQRK
jgi:hypothetical protein